jgi:uncharacterized membrane protein YeaQ/YmgE (transglycosylase-associated protein family)
MNISGEGLIIILLVGITAGWLAGQFVQGSGFGIIGDLILGISGGLIGTWILSHLDIHLGTGIVAVIANATIGAVLLLSLVGLARGWRGRWAGNWHRGWWS